jgi:DNA repair exonuclease SbcCD ATPase subunit
MRNLLPPIGILVMMAAAIVWLVAGDSPSRLIGMVTALPLERQIAVAVIALCALWLVGALVWQAELVARQGKAIAAMQDRLGGVRQSVAQAVAAQVDTDDALRRLADGDPDVAVTALDQRLKEAERKTALQQSHNEAVDMQERVDDLRNRQRALRQLMGEVIEKRRGIEPIIGEINVRQEQLSRSLAELETDAGGMSIADRLARFADDVKKVQQRLKASQDRLEAIGALRDELIAVEVGIPPLRDAPTGVASRLADVDQLLQRLAHDLDAIEAGPVPLEERLQAMHVAAKEAQRRVVALVERVTGAQNLRDDIANLMQLRSEIAQSLAGVEGEGHVGGVRAMIDELDAFTAEAQLRCDGVDKSLAAVRGIRDNLQAYQAALAVLQDPQTGLRTVLSDTRFLRDRLLRILNDLELDGEQTLAVRVADLVDSKRDAQLRIATLSETFARMDTTRQEIEALFTSLAAALNTYLVPSDEAANQGDRRG